VKRSLNVVEPFYNHPAYISALVDSAKPTWIQISTTSSLVFTVCRNVTCARLIRPAVTACACRVVVRYRARLVKPATEPKRSKPHDSSPKRPDCRATNYSIAF
jgi:hypothetical protein